MTLTFDPTRSSSTSSFRSAPLMCSAKSGPEQLQHRRSTQRLLRSRSGSWEHWTLSVGASRTVGRMKTNSGQRMPPRQLCRLCLTLAGNESATSLPLTSTIDVTLERSRQVRRGLRGELCSERLDFQHSTNDYYLIAFR